MGNSLFCTITLFLQMTVRGRILEDIHGIEVGLAKVKKQTGWCVRCERCKLIWYLTSAIKLGDPYKIVEINDLLTKMDLNFESSADVGGYIKESKAWIGVERYVVGASEETSAALLIHKWKLHQLTPSDLNVLRTSSAHLRWMLEIVRASVLEMDGDYDTAVQDYRRALKIMPRWLPEAKTTFEKINELGHGATKGGKGS